MKELLRSNDPVLLSYVSALLEEGDIGFIVRRYQHERARGLDRCLAPARPGRERKTWASAYYSHRGRHRPCHRRRRKSLASGRRRRAPPAPTIFSAAASASSSRAADTGQGATRSFSPLPSRRARGDRVLDIGAGVGVAGLCLLARVPGIEVTAVEIDAGLSAFAAQNAARNGFAERFQIINADVTSPGKTLRAAGLEA